MSKLGLVKNYLQFILSLISVLALLAVGAYLHVDGSGSIVAVFGIYVTGRSLVLGSYGIAASRDETANTHKIITETSEK